MQYFKYFVEFYYRKFELLGKINDRFDGDNDIWLRALIVFLLPLAMLVWIVLAIRYSIRKVKENS